MELIFDISTDELPIFLAETDEHLQVLDDGLLRLERQEYDSELIQQIFRAAHTLKGSAGMIGHQRLVELTHALEMAFDGIRKNDLVVNGQLVDICLDAVDGLRLLRDEVVEGKANPVDVQYMVKQINDFIRQEKEAARTFGVQSGAAGPTGDSATAGPTAPVEDQSGIWVEAKISPKSIASAARAFQIMLALQDFGEILSMTPTQEQIETAAPVVTFKARLKSTHVPEEIHKVLNDIPEIETLHVQANAQSPQPIKPEVKEAEQPLIPANYEEDAFFSEEIAPRVGEHLVSKGYITQEQLQRALVDQKVGPGKKLLIGNLLVEEGVLTRAQLETAIAELLQQQRKAIKTLQQNAGDQARGRVSEKTVRTSVERLDSLMNLVGELITDRNRLFKIRGDLETQMRGHEEIAALGETITHVGRITDQLQEEVMRIRMLPISNVFNKFPRMVRDLAQKVGKEINLVIQGQDTELDRTVIEEINDPIIHLLRNGVDHGIESPADRQAKGKPAAGTIRLTARHEQGQIIISVEDDGNGINVERLKQSAVQKGLLSEAEAAQLPAEKAIDLIFLSGLTTAKTLTNISGRGVGMDIVRSNIEKINGSILVDTQPDRGTTFKIVLPLTLAIVPTLLVRVGVATFAIPLIMVTETLRITQEDTQSINGRPVILLRDHVLPIMKLGDVFDLPMETAARKFSYVVVVGTNKMRIGLVVDALVGEEEVVVKSLGRLIGEVTGISSAAILGDGQVSLIVDVPGLLKLAGIH